MSDALLELKGLKKSYRGKPALRGIDLEVRPNEIFALLGPTGAGKSSTVQATAGLLELEAGKVVLGGRDVTDIDPAGRDLSIVFEGFNLLPVLNVFDNIAFALRSPSYREDEAVIRKRVQHTAELLRIAQHLDRDVNTLSGGEKQRVAIARALVRQPMMFLLDEPLSALDLKLREGLRSELRQIHRDQNSTMLYATHDYHGAISIADRIGVINHGRILQSGTIEEIFDRPANAFVGRLIGSPAMAFFDAALDGTEIRIKGCEQTLPASQFALDPNVRGEFELGVWPEDIRISDAGSDGSSASVYAVDNRGFECAVQIDFGAGLFRKVLDEGQLLRQGENCEFQIADGAGFLFDKASGERISHQGKGDR
jgi:multiple sugar transport system ATP-binding protein